MVVPIILLAAIGIVYAVSLIDWRRQNAHRRKEAAFFTPSMLGCARLARSFIGEPEGSPLLDPLARHPLDRV